MTAISKFFDMGVGSSTYALTITKGIRQVSRDRTGTNLSSLNEEHTYV